MDDDHDSEYTTEESELEWSDDDGSEQDDGQTDDDSDASDDSDNDRDNWTSH